MRYSQNFIKELGILRKQGHTLGQLAKRFSIPKTSVWHHIKNIRVPKRFYQPSSIVKSKMDWLRAEQETEHLLSNRFTDREKILVAAAIYWGEGAKRDFNLANSNPELVRVFLQCLETLGIERNRFALHVRTFEDLDPEKTIAYWQKITGISKVVRTEIIKGKKNGKLPYGMCRVRLLRGGYHLKLLQSLHKKIAHII